ncbi:MAG: hypothetical protein RSF67_09215 [Clostridia bacterium]
MAIIELSDMIGAIKLCYPINYDKVSLFLEKPEEELNLYDAICAYENNINDKTLKNLLYVIYIQYNKLSSMLSNKDLYRMTLKTMEVMQNDN